jgi:hypothetical protein
MDAASSLASHEKYDSKKEIISMISSMVHQIHMRVGKLWRTTSLEPQLFIDQNILLIPYLRRSLSVLHSLNILTYAKWYVIQTCVDLSYHYSCSNRSARNHVWEHMSWTVFSFPGSCKSPHQRKRYQLS